MTRASSPLLVAAERFAERWLKLEHGANVGPLLHVACYYAFFIALVLPHAVVSPSARGALWCLLLLTNYSLTVGVLHMHCHRPLFTARFANRALELALVFPSLVTATEMVIVHVHNHHKHDNGPRDFATTVGSERGWRAVAYWFAYGTRVKSATVRELFRRGARPAWRARRGQFLFDWLTGITAAVALLWWNRHAGLWLWAVPLAITHFTVGYFAWLTHAPASRTRKVDGSMNTVSNVMGLFIFNQGYHAIHHRHPGIHWTEIPDKLPMMEEVDPRYIVPYWVTVNSAWRIVAPCRFLDGKYGESWKRRLAEKRGRVRIPWFPYFAWV